MDYGRSYAYTRHDRWHPWPRPPDCRNGARAPGLARHPDRPQFHSKPRDRAPGQGPGGIRARDLADLASANAACDAIIAKVGPGGIAALSLNAGLNSTIHADASKDGYEIHFAVNHLAHVLIADRLVPYVESDGRVVITSSVTHDPEAFCLIGIERAEWQDPYIFADPHKSQDYVKTGDLDRGEARYSVSKLCNVMHARTLAKEYPPVGRLVQSERGAGTEIVAPPRCSAEVPLAERGAGPGAGHPGHAPYQSFRRRPRLAPV